MKSNVAPTRALGAQVNGTRKALLAAGQRLLADRSIDAVAIDEIVQAAGVAKGSFYNHFEDKDAFATTILHDIRREIEAAVEQANKDVADPALRVVRALSVYVDFVLSSHQRASVLLRINVDVAKTSNPLNKGVLKDIAAGLRSGRFVVPSIAAGALFVIGACEVAMMSAVEETDDEKTLMLTQQVGSLLLRGLGIGFAEAESLSAIGIYLQGGSKTTIV